VNIYNILGQLMHQEEIEVSQFLPAKFQFNVERFKTGTYFLRLENREDFTSIKFMVL